MTEAGEVRGESEVALVVLGCIFIVISWLSVTRGLVRGDWSGRPRSG